MQDIYGNHRPEMEEVLDALVARVKALRTSMEAETGFDLVEHILARVADAQTVDAHAAADQNADAYGACDGY